MVPLQSTGRSPAAVPCATRRNLQDQITVFVMTVGAPTFGACLEHLRHQDCRFELAVIDHIAPISAASQCMLDRCRTPFFVQVDEDMLLRPHAVRTLHERLQGAPAKVAEVVGALFDVHLERAIEGVKIYRHAILRDYPFEDADGCDIRQVRRLEADGFEVLRHSPAATARMTAESPEIMGLHGTEYVARTIYERYLTYWLKFRRGTINAPASQDDPRRFLERFLREPSELNFFALMGVVSAYLIDADAPLGEKDFRAYDSLPGFEDLLTYWSNRSRDPGHDKR